MLAKLKSREDLEKLRRGIAAKREKEKPLVTVCNGTGCHASGCVAVTEALREEVGKRGLADKVDIKASGCHGFCEQGPIVGLQPGDIFYRQVKVEDVPQIVEETVIKGSVIDRLLYVDPATGKKYVHPSEVPFYQRQRRIVFVNNGRISPDDIEDYIALGGYSALAKVLFEKSPQQVIEEVKRSELRGRGGAGFPTGRKWESCRNAPGEPKYVIANCDEGDPGVYANRSLLEGNPHSVLEGLIICAYAVGSHQGYIYVRNEYPLAVKNAGIAIKQAEQWGFLGRDILGSGFDFVITINRGGGAFVCGESSALMASLEGKVGEPRAKYIHTVERGLWD